MSETRRTLPVANIHVPASNPIGPVNLQIGIDRGVWGWSDSAWSSQKTRASIESLAVGQPLLLVLGGPNPRTHTWESTMTPFRRVAGCTVIRVAYQSAAQSGPTAIIRIASDCTYMLSPRTSRWM